MFKSINKKKFIIILLAVVILTLGIELLIKKVDTDIDILENDIVASDNISDNEVDNLSILKDKYNNEDIVANIKIDNTNIDEAVAQTSDNDYYLSHNLYGDYYALGSIYMDYRIDLESSKKILIFGHNSSYYGSSEVPFSELEEYYDYDYYKEHKYITLTLESEIRTYEIFSVYVEVSDFTYMNLNFDSDDDWYRHIISLKNKSLYDTGVSLSYSDEILILQTCSYNENYASYNKKYLLVISKRI